MKMWDFETHQKRFQNFEIGPKLSETHVFQGTILTTPPGLKQFV